MKPSDPRILTINGGSSSIKFALFEAPGWFGIGRALRK
jgi:acetate kinase